MFAFCPLYIPGMKEVLWLYIWINYDKDTLPTTSAIIKKLSQCLCLSSSTLKFSLKKKSNRNISWQTVKGSRFMLVSEPFSSWSMSGEVLRIHNLSVHLSPEELFLLQGGSIIIWHHEKPRGLARRNTAYVKPRTHMSSVRLFFNERLRKCLLPFAWMRIDQRLQNLLLDGPGELVLPFFLDAVD